MDWGKGGNTMTEEQNNTSVENTPKSFDEILNDKEYQSEFDKRVAKALDTAKTKWKEEAEAEKYHRDTEMSTCSEIRHENKMKYV